MQGRMTPTIERETETETDHFLTVVQSSLALLFFVLALQCSLA